VAQVSKARPGHPLKVWTVQLYFRSPEDRMAIEPVFDRGL
jgi:hypothetical protein